MSEIPVEVERRGAGRSIAGAVLRARETRILALVLLAGLALLFSTPHFATYPNLMAVAIGLTSDAVIAVAMTVVLITGGFDLSVGSVLALSGVVAGQILHGDSAAGELARGEATEEGILALASGRGMEAAARS